MDWLKKLLREVEHMGLFCNYREGLRHREKVFLTWARMEFIAESANAKVCWWKWGNGFALRFWEMIGNFGMEIEDELEEDRRRVWWISKKQVSFQDVRNRDGGEQRDPEWHESNEVHSTVFSRIIAAAIWWISKDKQRGSESIVYKFESEKSNSA
jgi:hypothetical protein